MAVDRETKRVQTVLEPPPNSAMSFVAVSPDERTLYSVRADKEENIFLLTFQ